MEVSEQSFCEILKQVCSSNKLERDKAILLLEKLLLANKGCGDGQCIQKHIINILKTQAEPWECKHGCLQAAKCLLPYLNTSYQPTYDFTTHLRVLSVQLLVDPDFRVRLSAGELLGALCQKFGVQVYYEVKETVLKLVRNNLDKVLEEQSWSSIIEREEAERLVAKLQSGPSYKRRSVVDVSLVINESSGWRTLETSLKCLDCLLQSCARDVPNLVDDEFWCLIFKTLSHSNHSVRQIGFQLCSTLFKCATEEQESDLPTFLEKAGHLLCQHLANGLQDNWSNVRLAASCATRSLLLPLSNHARDSLFPLLLPRMCLNRYLVVDGVRIYSQETWRQVTGATGRELVHRYIDAIVDYYLSAIESENQSVREAACSCMSELACKIPPEAVSPYVTRLLAALDKSMSDEWWPVRDAACLACGNFILSFPEESEQNLNDLYPKLFQNLADGHAPVRQGAAAALANIVRTVGQSALTLVLEHLLQSLKGMDKQERSPSRSCSPVHNLIRSSDTEASSVTSQPWHLADGCVHLVGELSSIKDIHSYLIPVLPLFKDATKSKDYEEHATLLESVCKQLPVIAKNLGKKTFATVVDYFFDDLFYALGSENGLTSSAASQCLNTLATFLGQNILRAKISNYNPRYVTAFESVIHVAPF